MSLSIDHFPKSARKVQGPVVDEDTNGSGCYLWLVLLRLRSSFYVVAGAQLVFSRVRNPTLWKYHI